MQNLKKVDSNTFSNNAKSYGGYVLFGLGAQCVLRQMQFCSAKESAFVEGTGILKSDSTALFGLHCLRIVSPWAYFRQPVVPICCRSQNSFLSASQFQGNMVLCIETMTEGGAVVVQQSCPTACIRIGPPILTAMYGIHTGCSP